jgi:hypothetical protein
MIRQATFHFLLCTVFLAVCRELPGAVPCKSGPQPGQRPGPYAAVISTGPERGQSYCYICETADRPAVVIFARSLSEPLGRLVQKLDKALAEYKAGELRAWVTLLNNNQPECDAKVIDWGKRFAIRSIPLGVFESADGPPSYRLAREADVTVLLFVKKKVMANYAFRTGELTEARLAEVLQSLPLIATKETSQKPAASVPPSNKK